MELIYVTLMKLLGIKRIFLMSFFLNKTPCNLFWNPFFIRGKASKRCSCNCCNVVFTFIWKTNSQQIILRVLIKGWQTKTTCGWGEKKPAVGEAGSKAGHGSQWIPLPSVGSCSSNTCLSTQVVSARNSPTRDGLRQEKATGFSHVTPPGQIPAGFTWQSLSAKVRVQRAGQLPSAGNGSSPRQELHARKALVAPTTEHGPALIRSCQAPQQRACTAPLHKLSRARGMPRELVAPRPEVRSPVRSLRLQHFQRYS